MRHSITIFWRLKDNHYKIYVTKCRDCGKTSSFKRLRCPYCSSKNVEYLESKGLGELINYAISYYRTEGSEQYLPRVIGLVRLDEGSVVVGEVTDVDLSELSVGMRVEAVLRKYSSEDPNGLIYYGLKFIPVIKR
ncbi:MAG: Zn-ribbon domain-containing OB-fold protein [Thermoprotei archaeon]